jgi:hypothetical protein
MLQKKFIFENIQIYNCLNQRIRKNKKSENEKRKT